MKRKDRAYTPEEVFSVVRATEESRTKAKVLVDFDGDLIKVTSLRLQLFASSGVTCVKCGLHGQYLYKERHSPTGRYHLNLYGVQPDGTEVLMTKDHIVPVSRGGKNYLGNLQVMCALCNEAKADGRTLDPPPEDVNMSKRLTSPFRVDGVRYRWRLMGRRHFIGQAKPTPYLIVRVCAEEPGAILRCRLIPRHADVLGDAKITVSTEDVERVIRHALEKGWLPYESGPVCCPPHGDIGMAMYYIGTEVPEEATWIGD